MQRYFLITLIVIITFLHGVESHGYLSNPPARNAMWKYGFNVPANYELMSLNCGGRGGKCSVCGDSFYSSYKPHEAGGPYAKGIIVKTYTMGSTINVGVTITANHKGYFEFRICPVTNNNVEVTQECLNQNQLIINNNSFRRSVDFEEWITSMSVKLPEGLTCERCVLQWYWRAEITLEDYFNCADIRIVNGLAVVEPTVAPQPKTTNSRGCKELWDNSCTSHSQCCTGLYCNNNNGAWALGVCRWGSAVTNSATLSATTNSLTTDIPTIRTTTETTTTLTTSTTTRPTTSISTSTLATTTHTITTSSTVIVGSGCKAEWDNRCTSHSQCCTGFCDNNNGAWAFGVCKISNVPTTTRPTTTIATTTSTLSTSTSRSATTNVSTTATTAPIGLQTLPLSATTTVSSKVRCFRGNGFCNYNLP